MSFERFEVPVPAIYAAKNPKSEEYDCLIPAKYAAGGFLGDCNYCNSDGEHDPENQYVFPVHCKDIGEFIDYLPEY